MLHNKEGKDEKDLILDSRLGYRRRGLDITALLKGRYQERQVRRPSAKETPLNVQASLEFGGGGQDPLGCVFQKGLTESKQHNWGVSSACCSALRRPAVAAQNRVCGGRGPGFETQVLCFLTV